jgi:hypothetical protein
MIRNRGWVVCLIVLLGSGCAAPQGPQTADLTAPPAPRLEWARAKQVASNSKMGEPRAQDMVIREHRFVSHSPELNLDGEDQVQRIVTALRHTQAKIVIESSGGAPILATALSDTVDESSKLDSQRRQYVIQKLLLLGIPDAEDRVVLEPSK